MEVYTLRDVVNRYLKMSFTSMQELEELAVVEEFEKGAFISKQGQFNHKEYMVLAGVCRSCLFNPEGIDTTISFFTPGSVLSPYVIRTEGQLSNLNVQASTDLSLVSFEAKKFEELMVNNLEIREFGNEVLKRELASMFQKEIGLASLSSKDRLVKFRTIYPLLENLIPHAEIASYLGITTISLSRLRRDLMP